MRSSSVSPSSAVGIGVAFAVSVLFIGVVALWMLFGEHHTGANPIVEVLRDAEFWRTVERTLTFTAVAIVLKATLAWLFVPFISKPRGSMLTSVLLIPWVVPTSVAALAWLWFFYDIDGGANLLLMRSGGRGLNWLGSSHAAFAVAIALNVWRETPLWAVAIAPSISGGNTGVGRLGNLDGLSRFQHSRLIILPRIRPVVCALALLSTIWTMAEFESIWILTRGGPGDATELITVYAFRHAFLGQDVAFGAAAYICLLPVMSCVLLLFFWLYRRATERGYL